MLNVAISPIRYTCKYRCNLLNAMWNRIHWFLVLKQTKGTFILNFTKQLLFEKVNFAPVISNEKWKNNNKKWRDNSKIGKYVSSTINNDNNCVTGYEVSGLRQIYFRLKAVWKKHLPNQIGTIFNLPAKQHSWFGPHLIHSG